jgi:hypothetical protein
MNAELPTPSSAQVPDVSMATTDIVFGHGSALQLAKQLDSFTDSNSFLGKFRMLGRTERRRGGAQTTACNIFQCCKY